MSEDEAKHHRQQWQQVWDTQATLSLFLNMSSLCCTWWHPNCRVRKVLAKV